MANMKTIVAKSRLGNVNVGKLVMNLLSGVSLIVECYVMGVNVSTESLDCGRESIVRSEEGQPYWYKVNNIDSYQDSGAVCLDSEMQECGHNGKKVSANIETD